MLRIGRDERTRCLLDRERFQRLHYIPGLVDACAAIEVTHDVHEAAVVVLARRFGRESDEEESDRRSELGGHGC